MFLRCNINKQSSNCFSSENALRSELYNQKSLLFAEFLFNLKYTAPALDYLLIFALRPPLQRIPLSFLHSVLCKPNHNYPTQSCQLMYNYLLL